VSALRSRFCPNGADARAAANLSTLLTLLDSDSNGCRQDKIAALAKAEADGSVRVQPRELSCLKSLKVPYSSLPSFAEGMDGLRSRDPDWGGKFMTRKALAAALGAVAVVVLAGSAQAQQNPPGIDPEHYQCYPVTQVTPPFQARSVRLKDQFGSKTVRVVGVVSVCNPVSKNNGLLADTKSHLVCYRITATLPGRPVEVANQFGVSQLLLGNANMLCLPSLKRILTSG
jgi:hypothetical protein